MSSSKARQKSYFEIVLGKDYDTECWTSHQYQDYAATVRLYNKFGHDRTYEQFLLQMLGGKR